MRTRSAASFTTITTEGAILPADLLRRIAEGDRELEGLTPESFHLSGERLNEAISRSWNRLVGAWTPFEHARQNIAPGEPGTSITRERWLLPLFQELAYGRLQTAKALQLEGKTYPISHVWGRSPIHLVGFTVDLDRRTPGLAGAARTSPHSLVQEFLNRSHDHLWGFVSNGLKLRVLRDNASLTRQAYVEFDLEAMMRGEVYSDFALLWLLCHQSRVEGDPPEACWLERWSRAAAERGTRALDRLRDGVQRAIEALGQGFLTHPANRGLRDRLRVGQLTKEDYYRQLLRLVYRLILVFTAEDRELLRAPSSSAETWERYLRYYSTRRLRELAGKRRGGRHPDLYRMLRVVMEALGREAGCPELGLPGLGSYLWSEEAVRDVSACELANRDLLAAVRELAFTEDDRVLRPVDYKNLGAEELGSIYESLLELHPEVQLDAGTFELNVAAGHERKTTGSYYTPTSLIQSLLEAALDPVLNEAVGRGTPEQAERAILSLKICDPAAGSGHFLIAAAHRMARRLAAVRTGDAEPAPEALRRALRDVIGHCIYAVDVNPMAVELCKVNLWLESLDPGRPLSFLDHRILCGNSLLGTTPALIAQGIPDEAFSAIAGDDKKVTSALKRQNRAERKGQRTLFKMLVREAAAAYGALSEQVEDLVGVGEEDWEAVRRKEESYRALLGSAEYRRNKLVADAWCAAFVWHKTRGAPTPITAEVLRRLQENPDQVPAPVREEIALLAERYRFFHWHLGFPDVFRVPAEGKPPENRLTGWSGGFDVVLGNPPWERVKIQEKEFFAERHPEIAAARNAAQRRKMILALENDDPGLYAAFQEALREADGMSHLIRNSGRYPLCGRGDVNTYAIFAELNRSLVQPRGRVGCIVPTGIATDDTTKFFFQDLVEKRELASLYDFENRRGIFPSVHRSYKFCLLTLTGRERPAVEGAEFAFFLHDTSELREEERRFRLSAEDIALLNPNTRTCPIFRTRRDAELTKAIYRRVPVFIREGPPEENPWGVRFMAMFHMANDSGLFRTREELEADGWRLVGNVFHRDGRRYLPLYEGKMVHHFDHRFGDYADLPPGSKSTQLPDVSVERKQDPDYAPLPRYWVPEEEVEARLAGRWDRGWLLGWRDITNVTNERTVIASVVPRVGCGHTLPLFLSDLDATRLGSLCANLNALVLDYVARQKVGGTHLTYGYLNQLPTVPPTAYKQALVWNGAGPLTSWFAGRILELQFTATDLEAFARDAGYAGSPFRWDEHRRFLLRCELDAAFFHLYLGTPEEWRQQGSQELLDLFPTPRDAVEYVLDTFPIVREKDEKTYGEYRAKRVILEIYDEMQRAIESAEPYRTKLDPPPAHPRVAHGAPPAAIRVSPFRRLRPRREEKYRTCVPMITLKAAAGTFGEQQDPEFVHWVTVPSGRPLKKGMFVAQVTGRSMEPTIPDGAYCLFRYPVLGTRQGKVVLVQHHDIHDPETGGTYTVKRYVSKKQVDDDGNWRHTEVRLEPENPSFQAIVLDESSAEEVRVIAEFVEVVSLEPPAEAA